MIVKCTNNNVKALAPKLQEYAFGQDDQDIADITVGKGYKVYGIRDNDLGRLYLVLTDTINTRLPWWMTADFFEVIDDKKPTGWQPYTWEGYGNETVWSNPVYFDAMEDVEEGTDRGLKIFEKMKQEVDAAEHSGS